MPEDLQIYHVKDWRVFGRNSFQPPFKISDKLINEARIVHVVKGHSKLYSADHQVELTDGDVLVMKVDNFINNWQANADGSKNQVIVFNLTADFLRHVFNDQMPSWLISGKEEQLPPVFKAESNALLSNFYENLTYYLDHPKHINEELIQLKVRELILILADTDQTGTLKKLFGMLFNASEYDFQDVIQTHLFEDLGMEDLAFLAGLSLSSFNRKFKRVFGTSPTKYITSKRLERAQILLSTTDERISDIAYETGFNDIGYFSRTFRNYYALSPSEFRKQHLTE